MATAGTMTRVFAEGLALSEAQVASRYRALREAGLVTKGGRGRFAPTMSLLDGARLLIALMGAEMIAETKPAVEIFGQGICAVCEGDDDPLAEALRDLVFEETIALLLDCCLTYRLGDPGRFERLGRDVTINLSPTQLTATVSRPGFIAIFQPAIEKTFPAGMSISSEMSVSDRMWLRADRRGLQTEARVEMTDLLELAPAFGPADSSYLPTH